jgi:hypothetical protein
MRTSEGWRLPHTTKCCVRCYSSIARTSAQAIVFVTNSLTDLLQQPWGAQYRREADFMVVFRTVYSHSLRAVVAIGLVIAVAGQAIALDKNGNFESQAEQDAYIAETLKKMAREMNSQMPIQLDEETRAMSVIALQKTITFNYRLTNYAAAQVQPKRIEQDARQNLNLIVCKSKATQGLIDMGVQYIYLYSGNDGKFVTRVVVDRYSC